MRIAIGNDHAGYNLKLAIIEYLKKRGIQYRDFGSYSREPVDYPDYAFPVAMAVSKRRYDRGILICGTGIGMSIVVNKFPGVRGAVCHNLFTARVSRQHNNANILLLGGRVLDKKTALKIVRVWLDTEPEAGRHRRRVKKIQKIERMILKLYKDEGRKKCMQ